MKDNYQNNPSCLMLIIGLLLFYAIVDFIESTFGAFGTIGIIIFLCYFFRNALRKFIGFICKWGLRIISTCAIASPMLFFIIMASNAMGLPHGTPMIAFTVGAYIAVSVTIYLLVVKPIAEKYFKDIKEK